MSVGSVHGTDHSLIYIFWLTNVQLLLRQNRFIVTIAISRAVASRIKAAQFFYNKNTKCEHNGVSFVMYAEFLSCKPAVMAFLNSTHVLGLQPNNYEFHIFSSRKHADASIKRGIRVFNKLVKFENLPFLHYNQNTINSRALLVSASWRH